MTLSLTTRSIMTHNSYASVIIVSVFYIKCQNQVHYADSLYAEGRYTECGGVM
jgi:hypothetical protein